VRVQLSGADHTHPVSLLHRGRRGYYEDAWPYVPADFARTDESDDAVWVRVRIRGLGLGLGLGLGPG